VGFTEHLLSPAGLVSSYFTLSPLLPPMQNIGGGGLLSVALSFPSPGLGITQHLVLRSPDFPPPGTQPGGGHLSSSNIHFEA